MTYSMDYSGDQPEQAGKPQIVAPLGLSQTGLAPRHRRRFVLPSIIKTATTFAMAGAAFFALEAYAPVAIRPSSVVGTYNARLVEAEKAAELREQAKYEVWAADVKVSVEQQVEQYKAFNQGSLARYQAALERGKLLAQATTQIQSQYVAARMGQTQVAQSGDQSIINLTRMFGRVMNGLEPGSGNGALEYSDALRSELSSELTDAATKGATISVEGWDTGLPSVEDYQRDIESLKPIVIPAPPKAADETSSKAFR